MKELAVESDRIPDLESYLDRESALDLARRSLIGAPVYTLISLIMLVGTPILMRYGAWAAAEAALLLLLGAIRVWFAAGFEQRYDRIGERAVVQFNVLTAMQSLTLGVLAAMVIWEYWATQEVVLTIVLSAGCIAAGTSALSVRRSAHFIFLACVLGPFGVAVFLVGGLAKGLMILGFLVLMAFLVQDGGQARGIYQDRLKKHYEDKVTRRRVVVESQAKKEFLADIGHEMRTPVSSIIGMSSLLMDENLDKRPREFVEIIRRSSEKLLHLVDDIPGTIRLRPESQDTQLGSLDLRDCVQKVLDLYRPEASLKGLELLADIEELPGSVIFFDENHLEQVLVNLLSNAVEFTEQGKITLRASSELVEEGDVRIEFTVTDTGIGIPAELVDSIFDPFSSPGAATCGEFGGGGLGLPLCKGLVELMGGDISIQSRVGIGTTVTFTIRAEIDPADYASPRAAGVAALPDAAPAPEIDTTMSLNHPHQILVVDDDIIHREVLCTFLEKMGYRVDEAIDGQQAVAAVMAHDYDLIFMDLRMPHMSGVEATQWIREHFNGNEGVRIVALTGDASEETRDRCMDAKMDDFLSKPVMLEKLEAVLQQPVYA